MTQSVLLAALSLTALPVAHAQDAGTMSCGDLLIVLDRSGSMATCSLGGQTKEALAKAALRSIIQQFPTVPMGLFVFPSDMAGRNAACATGRKVIDVSSTGGAAIDQYLNMLRSSGGTPTGTTMQAVKDYAAWTPNHAHFVILITDGMPTCDDGDNGGTPSGGGANTCTAGMPGVPCDGMGTCECKNPTKMFDAIDAMAKAGIYTFVIGFEGMASGGGSCGAMPFNPDTLNQAAELGLVPNKTGTTKYYSATDAASLQAALSGIVAYVATGGDPEFAAHMDCTKGEFGTSGTGGGVGTGTGTGTGGSRVTGAGGSTASGKGGSSGSGAGGSSAADGGAGLGSGSKVSGCGCATAPAGRTGLLALALLAVLTSRARRRRDSRR